MVQDGRVMLRLLSDVLRRKGFGVEAAGDGVDAYGLLREGLEPDLLLTDLTMPRMGGLELIFEARKLQPQLAAVLLSGLSEGLSEGDLAEAQPLLVLQKPIRPDDLAIALARWLQRDA